MKGFAGRVVPSLTILSALCIPDPASADEIRLQGGGTIRGALQKPSSDTAPDEAAEKPQKVTVRALSGAELTISAGEIDTILERPRAHEEYVRRAQLVSDTVESRWELAEWCRKNKLNDERVEQLERIVELDPDHRKAHFALGHTPIDGKWVSRDDLYRKQGLVRYKGRYVSVEEKRVLEEADAIRKEEREWFAKVRRCHIWLKGSDAERSRRAVEELRSIDDPEAIRALANFLNGDDNVRVRLLYVNVLLNIPGPKATGFLVQSSLLDADAGVRSEALDGVVQNRADAARSQYVLALANPQNEIVRRAGAALQLVGNDSTVPALIEALVTTHQYQVNVPKRNTVSFSADGGFAPPLGVSNLPPSVAGGLLTGQYPNGVIIDKSMLPPPPMQTVTIARESRNGEVLVALEQLTGQSFGYDKNAWRIWWSSQKSGGTSPSIAP